VIEMAKNKVGARVVDRPNVPKPQPKPIKK